MPQFQFIKSVQDFTRNEDGATGTEYAIIAGILSIGVLAGINAVADETTRAYDMMAAGFKTVGE